MKIVHTGIQFCSIGIFAAVCYWVPTKISYLILTFLFVRIFFFLRVTKGKKIEHFQAPEKALFVVDMQEALCGKDGVYPNRQEFVERVNKIIREVECKNQKIIYICQEFSKFDFLFCCLSMGGRLLKGTSGTAFCSGLEISGNAIFTKNQQDAFTSHKLCEYLNKNRIDTIMIVGLDAAACVSKTALSAVNKGFHVSIMHDYVMSKKASTTDKALKKLSECGIEIH